MNSNFDLEQRKYNSSAISDYQLCPRYFKYTWVDKLKPKEPKPGLMFGEAFHKALYRWYDKQPVEECVKAFESLSNRVTPDFRTRGWGEAIFKQYVEMYGKEPYEVLHSEKTGVVEIGERLYGFTLDQVVKDRYIYVVDHKTTLTLGSSFIERYRPNTQIDGYCYACLVLVGECMGAIINGISTAQNPKQRFLRGTSPRTREEIMRFPEIFSYWTGMIEWSIKNNTFPMNTGSCHRWGKCMYWDLCVYGEHERVIRFKFKRGEDDEECSRESVGV